ncbi:FkbM family methyltransferase [bacterium]|nr:MAG: FkbM family methyltransferase [bacterium]
MKEIKKGDIVIDIGANIGYYALMEANLVGSKGKIYAIEPVPQNFKLLEHNIALNNYTNIETFNLAIGAKNMINPIYLTPHCNCCSMIKDESKITEKIMVKTVILDKFLKDKPTPNFIRMDTEGYEFEIIQGMKKTLAVKKPLRIFIEIHPTIIKNKVVELLDILEQHGFEVKRAAWEMDPLLIREVGLVKIIYNYFSSKINSPNLHPGYFNTNIKELKKILIKSESACHVFFEKK